MNENPVVDDVLEELLGGRDISSSAQRGRAVAERRLGQAFAGRAPRMRRRRVARPRLAIALASGLVLVSGVAVAATTDFADRVLGSKQPAADRVEVVREDPRPSMTQAELIDRFHATFVQGQIGDRLDGELSAPLIEDDTTRLSARRTAEGGVCMMLFQRMIYGREEHASWHPAGGSCGAFEDGWPLMDAIGAHNEAGTMSYGLVADGVAKVRFILDGKTYDATMGKGAFVWHYPEGAKPSDIEAVLEDGTVVRRDLTWAYDSHGPPSKPHVVK